MLKKEDMIEVDTRSASTIVYVLCGLSQNTVESPPSNDNLRAINTEVLTYPEPTSPSVL